MSGMILSLEELSKTINLDGLGKEINSEAIIERLEKKRSESMYFSKYYHFYLAEMERHLFKFTQNFYRVLHQFDALLTNEYFLQEYAALLADRRYTSTKKPDLLKNLSLKDKKIAQEALELLSVESHAIAWMTPLKEMGQRLKDKSINQWANFYSEAIELIESSLNDYTWRNRQRNGAATLQQDTTQELEKLKNEVQELLEKHQVNWEKYLDLSGEGILVYLREITKAPLKGLGKPKSFVFAVEEVKAT
jgi:hypothetical protein